MDTISRSYDIINAIRDEFNRVDALARSYHPKYAAKPIPKLTFFVKGRAAGWAKYGKWEVSINSHIAGQNLDQMKDTISHEIAHMVAYAVYGETGHGARWKLVHRMLGGSAERTYNAAEHGIKAIAGRRTNWYLYRNDRVEVWVGPKHHSQLQAGKTGYLTHVNSGSRILPEHYTGQRKVKA